VTGGGGSVTGGGGTVTEGGVSVTGEEGLSKCDVTKIYCAHICN